MKHRFMLNRKWVVYLKEDNDFYFIEAYPWCMMFRLRWMGGFDFLYLELGAPIDKKN